jgi:hypothetical protein
MGGTFGDVLRNQLASVNRTGDMGVDDIVGDGELDELFEKNLNERCLK